MTTRHTPAAAALRDQLQAASAEAATILNRMAPLMGGWIRHQLPSPPVSVILDLLDHRIRYGQLTLCPHLEPAAPVPTWWTAWAPGRIRCALCVQKASLRIKGTREDRRCDSCRRYSHSGLYSSATLLPAALAELPHLIGVWPPVTVLFGLCGPCRAAAAPIPGHGGDAA